MERALGKDGRGLFQAWIQRGFQSNGDTISTPGPGVRLRACSQVAAMTRRLIRSVLAGVLMVLLSALFTSWYGDAVARHALQRLTSALETRFERPAIDDWSAIRGLVALGGQPGRLEEAFRLMRDHPHLRLVVSGPNDVEMRLISKADETIRARTGIETDSLTIRNNTCGNALFSMRMIAPAPGERWLLVTSALHMPRALSAFRQAGFPVEPWPVYDGATFKAPWRSVLHEWIGLAAYRLSGCSDAFLPKPP
jgi:uncharacterized SAM-binding protein YcdF (DUF218 family)